MFQAIAIVISLAGMAAIIYTIVGAVSGRSLHIGLILAGFIQALQVFALGWSAITDPPQEKSSAQGTPTPAAGDSAAPDSASVSISLG